MTHFLLVVGGIAGGTIFGLAIVLAELALLWMTFEGRDRRQSERAARTRRSTSLRPRVPLDSRQQTQTAR